VSEQTSRRARVAALARSRSVDDPEFIDARRSLAAANIAAYVEKIVASAPPLTDDQKSRIGALLSGGSR
jgi:hypothetical protein